jgi:hypothetical protein
MHADTLITNIGQLHTLISQNGPKTGQALKKLAFWKTPQLPFAMA